MIAMTTSRPKNVRMRPPPAELPLPPAACWLTWSRGRLTGFFSWSAPAASADSTCHMKVVAATPPARRNRFMEDLRPALEEGGGSGRKTYIGVSSRGFRGCAFGLCLSGQVRASGRAAAHPLDGVADEPQRPRVDRRPLVEALGLRRALRQSVHARLMARAHAVGARVAFRRPIRAAGNPRHRRLSADHHAAHL